MAKPRKKYDPNKLKKWMSRVATRSTMLIQAQGLGEKGKIWIFDNKPVPTGEWFSNKHAGDFHFVFMTPHKWTVIAGVACRDPQGNPYFRHASQSTNNELIYYDPQIQEWIINFVAEQILEVNKEHILSSFFIALPNQAGLTTEDIEKLLHWLELFDGKRIKTHFEMLQIKAKAEQEIADYPLTTLLDKNTISALAKHNITDWMTLFLQEEEDLQAIKGIGKKRYGQILSSLQTLAKKFPNFYDLAYDSWRGEECRKFIFADAANAEAMYQLYLENKKK